MIPHTRAASVAWLPDASAFAYTRYPDPAMVGEGEAGYHRAVWWHRLGDDPALDEVVWGEDDLPDATAWPDVSSSPNGDFLLVHVEVGWGLTDVHLVERASGNRSVVVEGVEERTSFEIVGDRLYGMTTIDAPRGRVVTASVEAPAQWETFVAESDLVLEGTAVAGDSLLVASTDVAVARLHRYRLDGTGDHAVDLPVLGALAGLDADPEETRAFLAFQSFGTPPSLFRWTPHGLVPWGGRPSVGADLAVDAVRYTSTDGTEVPMFLVRAPRTESSPTTPVVLTGYGDFAIAETPAWSPFAVTLAELGAVLAVAGLRGGLEHGEAWHRAGMRADKQQVFDDFAAAADWLVETGHTSRTASPSGAGATVDCWWGRP